MTPNSISTSKAQNKAYEYFMLSTKSTNKTPRKMTKKGEYVNPPEKHVIDTRARSQQATLCHPSRNVVCYT